MNSGTDKAKDERLDNYDNLMSWVITSLIVAGIVTMGLVTITFCILGLT